MRRGAWLALALAAALLAGCGTPQKTLRLPTDIGRDGPEANPPSGLDKVPDAIPRVEPIRRGGPNKPYEINGQGYTPLTGDDALSEKGLASWYGRKFHGRRTASGETYNMYAMTAAHKTMPIPSYARVRNPANGREVIVRVNDRGPFARGRVIDLSYTAALKLGVLHGVAPVEVERITYEDIASGRWVQPGGETALASASPGPAAAPAAAATSIAPTAAAASAREAGLGADDLAAPEPAAPARIAGAAAAGPSTLPTPPIADSPPPPNTGPEVATAHTTAAKGFWVQIGAFGQRDGAVSFQRRVAAELDWLAPMLAIFEERPMHRLQAGPYASRDEARDAAEKIRAALALVPMVVERR